MSDESPLHGMELTHILVSADPERSRDFYLNVLGAELYRQYGSSVVLRLLGNWILLVEGGGPTVDKPTITFAPPSANLTAVARPTPLDAPVTIAVLPAKSVPGREIATGGSGIS